MILKVTVSTQFQTAVGPMTVSHQAEQIIDNDDEAEEFGKSMAELSFAFNDGFGGANLGR